MQQKIWQKGSTSSSQLSAKVETFTVGRDRELDIFLAQHDVLGSLAHIQMLAECGLLEHSDWDKLRPELIAIYDDIQKGDFNIADGVEDIHSEVEFRLTSRLGDAGKKIHSGRSRNDQVLLDLKLFTRAEIEQVVEKITVLSETLLELAEQHRNQLMPGYTHLQIAMLSSFGLWFSAYAESLNDDLIQLQAAFRMANKNPLGSGAGYGGSLPLNRTRTTELLGFEDLNYNVVYAQMNRGKMEKAVVSALSSLASTLSRMAMDMCLYMNQNFGFVSFPEELTTGSSIMPHKKNPDVWELIRAKCNQLQSLPSQYAQISGNLPSGYHRDMQVIKESYIPSFQTVKDCLEMADIMLQHIHVKGNLMDDERYLYLYSVEVVNQLVMQGTPFREAYIQVGKSIEEGAFSKPEHVNHTHEGSIGNLCLDKIRGQRETVLSSFPFERIHQQLAKLLGR